MPRRRWQCRLSLIVGECVLRTFCAFWVGGWLVGERCDVFRVELTTRWALIHELGE